MKFAKNVSLPILVCPICHGSGVSNHHHCRECRSFGFGRLFNGVFFYFGVHIDAYHIALRRARRWLDRFEFFGALVFGIGLLLFFAWQIFLQKLLPLVSTALFWLSPKTSVTGLLWLALMAFTFLAYKLLSHERTITAIPEGQAKHKAPQATPGEMTPWETIRRLRASQRHDIAKSFTAESRQVIEDAFALAMKHKSAEVTPPHLFVSLLGLQSISGIFIRLGIPVSRLKSSIVSSFAKSDAATPTLPDAFLQILFQAYALAEASDQTVVAPTEILLSTVGQSEPLQELLYDLSIDQDKLSNVVEWVRVRERLRRQYHAAARAASHRSKYGIDRAMTAVATPYLNSFSEDLTMAAKFGYLPPCVARDRELEEIFRVIEGGRQSILLVGEPGVGKMSIIEGIVEHMIVDRGPKRLHDKRLVRLSPSSLLAGTTVAGAQERLMRMMNEIQRAKNIILFINNIQDLMSVGADGGEGMDVSETLAEYAGRGDILVFAATTPEGYTHHIAESQMGQVFARVEVREVNTNQAIQVLESRVGGIEYKENVFFSYDAIAEAVGLAKRFLHDQRLPESAIEIATEAAALVHSRKGENHLVTKEDVAAVVSEKTGVPMTTISADEGEKLLTLEKAMHERMVGQNEAVDLVASALRRARTEIRSRTKPIANFLFLGPTGVGKTELAKTIAEVYFGGEKMMVRVDMSEFQDKQSVYRLIGEPGRAGTGTLTEPIRQRPFCLILLDEIEKADTDILNLFLQVFDDGRLTDSVGRVVDFTNTIIIATSNAGTAFVQDQMRAGAGVEDIRQGLIRGELKKYFRPEWLNRFDGIVLFTPLDREAIKQVASLMLKRVAKQLEERGVELRVEDVALESLSDIGWDPEFGARPMRRAIQDTVENKLADLILKGGLKRRDVVVVGEKGELRIERP